MPLWLEIHALLGFTYVSGLAIGWLLWGRGA